MMSDRSNVPLFKRTQTEVIEEEYWITLDDIVEYNLPDSVWKIAKEIVGQRKELLDRRSKEFANSENYKEFKQKLRESVNIGNNLLVIGKHVAEKYRERKKKYKAFRRYSSYFATLPRRTAYRLADFNLMTRYSKKKGTIQFYYFCKMHDIAIKYRDLKNFLSNEKSKRMKDIKRELEKLSYLNKTDEKLEAELKEIEAERDRLKQERDKYEVLKTKEINEITAEEKQAIKEILDYLSGTYLSTESIATDQHYGLNLDKQRDKVITILNESRKSYHREINNYVKTIENWEAVYESANLTSKIQNNINIIRTQYLKKEQPIRDRLERELEETVRPYEERYDKMEQRLEDELIKVRAINEYLKQKNAEFTKKAMQYYDKKI